MVNSIKKVDLLWFINSFLNCSRGNYFWILYFLLKNGEHLWVNRLLIKHWRQLLSKQRTKAIRIKDLAPLVDMPHCLPFFRKGTKSPISPLSPPGLLLPGYTPLLHGPCWLQGVVGRIYCPIAKLISPHRVYLFNFTLILWHNDWKLSTSIKVSCRLGKHLILAFKFNCFSYNLPSLI